MSEPRLIGFRNFLGFLIGGFGVFSLGFVIGCVLQHDADDQRNNQHIVDHGCGEWTINSQKDPTVQFHWLNEAKEAK